MLLILVIPLAYAQTRSLLTTKSSSTPIINDIQHLPNISAGGIYSPIIYNGFRVNITGINFSPSTNYVFFNEIRAAVISNRPSEIVAIVPRTAVTGNVRVTALFNGSARTGPQYPLTIYPLSQFSSASDYEMPFSQSTNILQTGGIYNTITPVKDGLLVAGGLNIPYTPPTSYTTPTKMRQFYNFTTGQFRQLANMRFNRVGHSAHILNSNEIIFVGGGSRLDPFTPFQVYKTSEIYNILTNTGKMGPMLPMPLMFHQTVQINNDVYIIGGVNETRLQFPYYLPVNKVYLLRNNVFTELPSMPEPKYQHTVTLLNDGRILVAGGITTGGAYSNRAYIFNPSNNNWTTVMMNVVRTSHTATKLNDGRVLIIGGESMTLPSGPYTPAPNIEIFNPSTNTFTQASSLNKLRKNHDSILLSDGNVLIVGGHELGIPVVRETNTAEIYNYQTGVISYTSNLTWGRISPTLVRLQSGAPLVIGGIATNGPGGNQYVTHLIELYHAN